jgi:hypothetical protein
MAAKVRWRLTPSDRYGSEVAGKTLGTFDEAIPPTRVELTAQCPRCEHATINTEQLSIQAPSDGGDETAESLTRNEAVAMTVAVDCQCNSSHAGRPKAHKAGCGARWALYVSGPRGIERAATVEAGQLADAPTAEDEAALESLVDSELASARKTAESWRTGILLFTGVLTSFSIFKGADAVTKLVDPLPLVAVGLAVLGFIFAIAGALLSLRASFGVPGDRLEVRRGLAQDIANWKSDEANRASERIWQATWAVVIAVALLGVATLVTWFGGTRPTAYLRVGASPETVCGKLTKSDETALTVTDAQNVEHSVPMTSVRSLEIVDSCK